MYCQSSTEWRKATTEEIVADFETMILWGLYSYLPHINGCICRIAVDNAFENMDEKVEC